MTLTTYEEIKERMLKAFWERLEDDYGQKEEYAFIKETVWEPRSHEDITLSGKFVVWEEASPVAEGTYTFSTAMTVRVSVAFEVRRTISEDDGEEDWTFTFKVVDQRIETIW